jgi:type IV secretion system protein VirB4
MNSIFGRYRIGAFNAPKAASVAELLPWLTVMPDGQTVLLKDGAFMAIWAVRGPDMASAPDYEFNRICMNLSARLNTLQGGWSVFFEDARIESQPYPESAISNPVARLIDAERRNQFSQYPHYENVYYLTVTYLPPAKSHSQVRRFFIENEAREGHAALPVHLADFQQQILALDEAFKRQFKQRHLLAGSEILSYLHSTISTSRYDIGYSDLPVFLDRLLSDDEINGGFYPTVGGKHLRVIGIRQLLGPTKPGLFEELNALPFPYRMVARFIALDDAQAQREISRVGRFWFQKRQNPLSLIFQSITGEPGKIDQEALRRSDDADDAALHVQERRASYGYCTLSLAILEDDRDVADARAIEIQELVRRNRAIPVIEKENALEAWLGMVPGNSVANVRRPLLSTIHFSHLAPISATWAGPDGVSHESLEGPAHVLCETNATTPFRFSTFSGDVGHFLAIGPTGAGKSVLLNLLAAQWLRYRNNIGGAQVYGIEAGGSMRCLTRALGGTYHDLESTSGSLSLQPLREVHIPEEREWAAEWLIRLFSFADIDVDSAQKQEIWSALGSLATQPYEHRTLSVLQTLLQDNLLRTAIGPFTIDGPAGRFIDSGSPTLPDEIEFVDLGSLLDASFAPTILDALFRRFEGRFNGRPTLFLIDEAWMALLNGTFADRLRSWLKTLRKRNVAVGLATQEVSDFLNSGLAQTLLNACPTQIYLPNAAISNAEVASRYAAVGLNETQISIIRDATPKSDYYFVTPAGSRLISFSLGPVARAFCAATSAADHADLSSLDPSLTGVSFASRWLEGKGLKHSANALTEVTRHAAE